MEDTWRTSPALGAAKEVIGTAPVVPTGPSTITLPSEDGPEIMAPASLDDTGLESSRGLERVDAAELLPSEDGARIAGGVGSSRLPPDPRGVFVTNRCRSRIGVVLLKGAVELALRCGDFFRGLEELKVLPLKEWRRRMKNGVFRVSDVITLSGVIFLGVI